MYFVEGGDRLTSDLTDFDIYSCFDRNLSLEAMGFGRVFWLTGFSTNALDLFFAPVEFCFDDLQAVATGQTCKARNVIHATSLWT